MRHGQERYRLGRCTATNLNGTQCRFGGSTLEPNGLRCGRHAEKVPPIPISIEVFGEPLAIGPIGPDPRRHRLLCEDCGEEIFADVNMVMLRDEIWLRVSEGKPKRAFCDDCIEKRLKRPIAIADLKPCFDRGMDGQMHERMIPCNEFWMIERRQQGKPISI